MADESTYNIFMYHPSWDKVVLGVAVTKEAAAAFIAEVLANQSIGRDKVEVHVVKGIPVEFSIKTQTLIKLEDDTFMG